MKKIFIIVFILSAPFILRGQGCSGTNNFLEFYYYGYDSNTAEFDFNIWCCHLNGYGGYVQNITIDWGDGTTTIEMEDFTLLHYYLVPDTYNISGSFYCSLDTTTYYFNEIFILECPEASDWWWDFEYYTDSIVGEFDWLGYPNSIDVVVDSIDWGDGISTNFEDTILSGSYPYPSYFHNYGTSLDTSYSFNISYRYLYDSSCTYNFSWYFNFPCSQVQNNGVTVNQSDINKARFYCANPNTSNYYEWYITEYGDTIQGSGTHIIYFPDTGYVHYCKYRQSLIDSTCFSYLCDSVYINDTIIGCTDPLADNYNPQANTSDPSSCLYSGCMDPTAFNYDPMANVPDSSCVYAHNIILQNWSLVSSYRQPINSSIEEMFSQTHDYHQLVVKNGLGQVYYPNYNVNQIDSVIPGEGFQVYLYGWFLNPVLGEMIIPEQTPIALPQGWSIVGYPRTSNGQIDSMLVDILPNVVLVKDDQGGVYWTQYGVNQIGNLKPGEGYQIKMSQSDTLFYPAN